MYWPCSGVYRVVSRRLFTNHEVRLGTHAMCLSERLELFRSTNLMVTGKSAHPTEVLAFRMVVKRFSEFTSERKAERYCYEHAW